MNNKTSKLLALLTVFLLIGTVTAQSVPEIDNIEVSDHEPLVGENVEVDVKATDTGKIASIIGYLPNDKHSKYCNTLGECTKTFDFSSDEPGEYELGFTAVDSIGMESEEATTSITVNEKPVIEDVGITENPVAGEEMEVTVRATDNDRISGIIFNLNSERHSLQCDTADVCERTLQFTPTDTGSHTLEIKAVDNLGEESEPQTETFTVNPDSEATLNAEFTWSPERPVAGEEVDFSPDIDSDFDIEEYEWRFDDGTSPSGEESPTHEFEETGEYLVTLTVEDSQGNEITHIEQVEVFEEEEAALDTDFTWTPENPNEGEEVTFNSDITSDNDIQSTTWSFHDGSTVSGNSATKTYEEPGVYSVELKATDSEGKTDTKRHGIHVGDVNSCDMGSGSVRVSSSQVEEGSTVETFLTVFNRGTDNQTVNVAFKTESGQNIGSQSEEIGSGGSQEFSASFTPSESSEVTAEINTESSGCAPSFDAGTADLEVTEIDDEAPPASFSVSELNPKVGDTIDFNAESHSDISNYSWEFGDGGTGSGESTTYAYESTGFNKVELTVSDQEGNSNTATKTIAVGKNGDNFPNAEISVSPENPSVDDEITLSGTSSSAPLGEIESYRWNVGDGSNETTGVTTTHRYSSPGTYHPRLEITDSNGNKDFAVKPVTVSGLGTVCDVDVGELKVENYALQEDKKGVKLNVESEDSGDLRTRVRFYKGSEQIFSDERIIEDDQEREFETTINSDSDVTIRAEVTAEGDCGTKTFERVRTLDIDEDVINHPGDGLEVIEVNHPESVCRGDSFAANVKIRNGRAEAERTAIQGSGLGTLFRGSSFRISSGEKLTQSVTFSNVDGAGERSFTVSLDNGGAVTKSINLEECGFNGAASGITSMEVSPDRIVIGNPVKVSGFLKQNGRRNVEIMVDGKEVSTVSSRPDGYYEARIQPQKAGMIQISVSTGSDLKSRTVNILPTVSLVNLNTPRKVQAGEEFEICGNVESQVSPRLTLKRNGEAVKSQKTSGEFCFDNMESEVGSYTYTVEAAALGAFDSQSSDVEVLKAGSEVEQFPEQIASVESDSGMVKVELYNTYEETRTYSLKLEDLPDSWTSQTEKTVVVPPNRKKTVYFYLTPKKEGQFEADLTVESEGEEVHSQELRISSRSEKPASRSLISRLLQALSL